MNNVMLPEINGTKITFISIFKQEFNSWNLKDQIVLTPQDIDDIPFFNISKIKIYNQKPIENHFLVKLEETKKDQEPQVHLYAVSSENHKFFYQKIFIYKLASMELEFDSGLPFNDSIEDLILKKSEFLGKWEERQVKISAEEGLTSKKVEKEKNSLQIKETKQIWSRFELVEGKRFFVMKCKYLLGKEEFAIPVTKASIWIRDKIILSESTSIHLKPSMKTYRKERIKFVKEAAQGQKILSHSLLDMTEFEDIDQVRFSFIQVYAKRKVAFKIAKRNVTFVPYTPISEEQAQYDMTPTQKIQIYKKLNIKERYNQASIDKLKKMFKIRRSRIPNMLNNLNETAKKQTESVFDQEMRRSEEKLKFYRSQGKIDQENLQSPKKTIRQSDTRCKFYSLKTGKPEMNENLFPTFQEFVEGRNRAKLQKKYFFDIEKIERNLSAFYTETDFNPEEETEKMKGSSPLSILAARIGRASSTASNRNGSQGIYSQRMLPSSTQNFKKRSRIQENLQRFSESYIEKTERSSQKIVRTMTNFYSSKNTKKQEYNNMVEFYEHDRPLTNSIRRKQYEFLKPEEKLKEITHYRKESESQRKQILLFNSRTYKQILNSLSRYHEDDIPVSLEILRGIKHLMRREYVFGEEDVRKVLGEIKGKSDQMLQSKEISGQEEKKQDFMIQPVIDIINQAYSFNLRWDQI